MKNERNSDAWKECNTEKCNIERVQREENATQKSATRKDCNKKKVQREKKVTWTYCNMNKVKWQSEISKKKSDQQERINEQRAVCKRTVIHK